MPPWHTSMFALVTLRSELQDAFPVDAEIISCLGFVSKVLEPAQLDEEEDGFDVIVDCCGVAKAVEKGIEVANKGATIIIFAAAPKTEVIQ